MAGRQEQEDLGSEVRMLTYRLEETSRQLGRLRINVTSWMAVGVLFASLFALTYGKDEDQFNLFGLVGEAGDADSGAVKVLGVVAIILIFATVALTLLAIADERELVAWAQATVAGVLLVVWLALTLAAGSTGGGGVVGGEPGFEMKAAGLLIPAGAILAFVASLVSQKVREWG